VIPYLTRFVYPAPWNYLQALEADAAVWGRRTLDDATERWRWIALVALTSPYATLMTIGGTVTLFASDGDVWTLAPEGGAA
jgi:hypothetical protein